MPTVYRKTAKGQSEIETRQYRLNPRLRTALILVDGQRSDTELRRMIFGEPDEALRALLEQGFIELVTDRRSGGGPTTVSPPLNSAPAPFGGTSPAPFGSTSPAPFGSTSPAPFGSTAPAPFGSTAPAPFGSTAPAPFGSTAPAPFGSTAPAPFGSTTPAPLLEPQVLTGKAFEQFRRDAIRKFTDAVGPMAEALAIKMEKARSHEDLRPLLALAMNIILNTRGAKVAGDFSARFLQ